MIFFDYHRRWLTSVCRFWFPFAVSVVLIAGVVVCSTSAVPLEWRANGAGWGAIFPLV
jgi:hypothetical protein